MGLNIGGVTLWTEVITLRQQHSLLTLKFNYFWTLIVIIPDIIDIVLADLMIISQVQRHLIKESVSKDLRL